MDRYSENEELSQYEFRVEGVLDVCWADWFDGMTIRHQQKIGTQSETILTGSVVDQVALHGILAKIRDLNLKLISFRKLESDSWYGG
ncbi:MAG: hypothetical protein PVH03_04800 [Chloroflexota bacterium]|jgi:hypothetical protein